jgi:hypothetical protein
MTFPFQKFQLLEVGNIIRKATNRDLRAHSELAEVLLLECTHENELFLWDPLSLILLLLHLFHSTLIFFLYGAGALTQGIMNARQTLHTELSPQPCYNFFF